MLSIVFHTDGLVKFPQNLGYFVLESGVGEQFDSIVTGASGKGTWVRLLTIPVKGKLPYAVDGYNFERGCTDFKIVSLPRHG